MIDDENNIEMTTKIGNIYVPKIMLTFMSLLNEDDNDENGDDEDNIDRFK